MCVRSFLRVRSTSGTVAVVIAMVASTASLGMLVGAQPAGATTYRPQTLYLADFELQSIYSIPTHNPTDIGSFQDTNSGAYSSVAADTHGDVYAVDYQNGVVVRYAADSFDNGPDATTFKSGCPGAVATNASGDVYVAEVGCLPEQPEILEYNAAGQLVHTIVTGHSVNGNGSMSVDSSGDVFYLDTVNVEEIPAGADPAAAPITVDTVSGANGVAVDPSGDHLYVSVDNGTTQQVNVYALTGPATYTAQSPLADISVQSDDGVAVDAEDNVFVDDTSCAINCIWEFPAGSSTATSLVSNVGGSFGAFAISPAVAETAPGAPAHVTAVSKATTAATGTLSVSFTAPANNGGSSITGYTATCTSSNGGAAKSKAGTASPLLVAGVMTAKSYKCTVKAKNVIGTGAASALSATITVGAPGAPTAVHAVRVGAGQLKVTFTKGAANGAPVKTNSAKCTSTNGGAAKSKAGAASPVTLTGLTAGKTYRCTVTSTNSRGAGPPSAATPPIKA